MKPHRLYVSGPMTGLPNLNVDAFNKAAEQLRAAGYEVTNPADQPNDPDWTWTTYMRADIRALMSTDAIASLPGWGDSRGATAEHAIGALIGMPARTVEEWIAVAVVNP